MTSVVLEKRYEMTTTKTLVSPRVTLLEQLLLSGKTTALELFWQEVTAHGAPLIETIEGDDTHAQVTFLWRGQADTRNAVVFVGPASWESAADHQMTRLLDTDLWYKTYRLRTDLRTTYLFSANDPLTAIQYQDFWTRLTPDPLNASHFIYPKKEEDPEARDLVMSILELPQAPPQPWILPRPGVASGQVEMHHLRSQILGNERRVWVYTPPDYTRDGKPYDLFLLFDGLAYLHLAPTPTILDNLLHEGKIPPLVAVLLDSLGQTRNRELPCRHCHLLDILARFCQ